MYFTASKKNYVYNDIYVLLYIIYYVYNGFPFRKMERNFQHVESLHLKIPSGC